MSTSWPETPCLQLSTPRRVLFSQVSRNAAGEVSLGDQRPPTQYLTAVGGERAEANASPSSLSIDSTESQLVQHCFCKSPVCS